MMSVIEVGTDSWTLSLLLDNSQDEEDKDDDDDENDDDDDDDVENETSEDGEQSILWVKEEGKEARKGVAHEKRSLDASSADMERKQRVAIILLVVGAAVGSARSKLRLDKITKCTVTHASSAGAIGKLGDSALRLWNGGGGWAVWAGSAALYFAVNFSPALISVGFIVGPEVGMSLNPPWCSSSASRNSVSFSLRVFCYVRGCAHLGRRHQLVVVRSPGHAARGHCTGSAGLLLHCRGQRGGSCSVRLEHVHALLRGGGNGGGRHRHCHYPLS